MPDQIRKNEMFVSIITPTYNRESLLTETIESVLNQSYTNFEFIILDDGSTDNTKDVVKHYNDPRITYLYHNNMGETATVNKGITLAKGEIVCMVNSDDPLLPGAIEEAVKIMSEDPNILAAYPDWVVIGPKSEFIRYEKLEQFDITKMLLDFNFGLGPGAFIRKSVFSSIGFRNSKLKYAGDMEFWMRLALHGKLQHIPKYLATHRTHEESASVFAKGNRLAYELVEAVKITLASPLLPEHLYVLKNKILGYVYYIAAKYYAGTNKYSILKNMSYSYFHKFLYLKQTFSLKICIGFINKKIQNLLKIKFVDFLKITQRCIKSIAKFFVLKIKILSWFFIDLCIDLLGYAIAKIIKLLYSIKFTHKNEKINLEKNNRFAFCTRFLPPMWSGQAVVIHRLLKDLDPKHYCLVTQPVYANRNGNNFIGGLPATYYDLPKEKQIMHFTHNIFVRWANFFWGVLQRGLNTAKILKNEQIDALIVGTGDQIDPIAACIASQIIGCRFYIHFFDDFTEQWWQDKAMRPIIKIMERLIVRLSTGLIAPNEFMKQVLKKRYHVTAEIVRNPAQHQNVNETNLTSNVFFKATEPKEIKLVFTGAIYHLNYDILRSIIAAISQIKDFNIKLHIFTAQPFEVLEKEGLCGEKVKLHAHVPPEEVKRAQNEADILLIPFSFEPRAAGIVRTSATAKLADYLTTGKPILAFCPQDSFLGWYFRQYDCGLLVPEDNVELIICSIYQILQDEELRLRLSTNAKNRARIEFDPKLAQIKLLEVIGIQV